MSLERGNFENPENSATVQEEIKNPEKQDLAAAETETNPEESLEAYPKAVIEQINNEAELGDIEGEVEKITKAVDLKDPETVKAITTKHDIAGRTERIKTESEKIRDEAIGQIHDVLLSTVTEKYNDQIEQIRKEKLDWVNSAAFQERLLKQGSSQEEVEQMRGWICKNITDGEVKVLPSQDFLKFTKLVGDVIGAGELMSQANAFYVEQNSPEVPESLRGKVFVQERNIVPPPPVPGRSIRAPHLDKNTVNTLSHEIGHQAHDEFFPRSAYKNYKLNVKDGSPDPEYVGTLKETDTRLRSMYRELQGNYDPKEEAFGQAQLDMLRKKRQAGELSNDTIDLFDHYDDEEIIRMANTLPAI